MRKKRRIRQRFRIIIALVIGAILGTLVSGGYYFYANSFLLKEVDEAVPMHYKRERREYSFDLFMVGDALIHSTVYQDAKKSDGSYDFKPMIDLIKPISSSYDLAYYNQETILGGSSIPYSNYPRFNSPQEVGDAFIDAGFDLVSLATNHTMDKGEQGALNSRTYWKDKEKYKVYTAGSWDSFEDREKVRIYRKNNINYAFFSYTMHTNGLNTPYGKEYLNDVYSDEKAKADIEKVKDKADVIIVAMHWGTEYSLGVNSAQTRVANYLSSLGVNLIIGAHPHVVEPVEYINGGKTFVIYSLGNILSSQIGIEKLTGLMMGVTVKKVVEADGTSHVSIVDPRADLTYTRYSNGRNFKVFPYSQLNDSILPNYQSYYNKYKAVVSSRYPELQWGITGA